MAEEKQEQKPQQKPAPKPEAKEPAKNDNFRYIVRVANTDLDGNKRIFFALRKIKGVCYSIANAACRVADVDINAKTGELNDAQVSKLTEVITNPSKFGIPSWIFNRRSDPENGGDMHLLSGDLQFARENDIKTLKKIKCYRGVRHMHGLPTRGQRTKSNFRRTKSRGKGGLGVQKKKVGKK